jgi:hypothetical protein
MKSIVIATAISLFLISCKKDGGGNDQQKKILLSVISSNGKITGAYAQIYQAGRRRYCIYKGTQVHQTIDRDSFARG